MINIWFTHYKIVATHEAFLRNDDNNDVDFEPMEHTAITKHEQTLIESDLDDKFVQYELVRGLRYKYLHDPCKYFCLNETKRISMPILKQSGVADFNVRMKTNLNIIYLGDGVGIQFAHALQEASNATDIQVIRYDTDKRNKISQVAKTSDGGHIAGLRITGWFHESGRDLMNAIQPNAGGGWMESDVSEMKNMINEWHNTIEQDQELGVFLPEEIDQACEINGFSCTKRDFDVAVHQIATEWIYRESTGDGFEFLEQFTLKAIEDSIQLIIDTFGVKIIILQTIPIINNIRNVKELVTANERIWTFAEQFRKRQENQVDGKRVILLIMDIGALSIFLTLHNALAIGTVSQESASDLIHVHSESAFKQRFHFGNQDFINATMKALDKPLQVRLKMQKQSNVSKILSHSCGEYMDEKKASEGYRCLVKNTFSMDGLQWCMDTMAGRINAAQGCLLQCGLRSSRQGDLETVKICESECNALYMTLLPISATRG